jgi:hypothetical protein
MVEGHHLSIDLFLDFLDTSSKNLTVPVAHTTPLGDQVKFYFVLKALFPTVKSNAAALLVHKKNNSVYLSRGPIQETCLLLV